MSTLGTVTPAVQGLTGVLVATPFHPCGQVLTEWAVYHLRDVMSTQAPPGTSISFYPRNFGETIPDAFTAIVRHAWRIGARFVFIVEHDLFIPDGALQALYYELNKAENADVAGIGGVYSWREGPVGQPFPLVFPKEHLGPQCDYTVGDVVEVEAAGQGCFLFRTDALATQPEPWFALDWRNADSPLHTTGAADMFFFRKLRSGQTPDGQPWRLLVHTGVVCEHLDPNTLEFSPPDWDLEYRERFGYALDSELIRRIKRIRERAGKGDPKGHYPSLVSNYGMTHGRQPQHPSPLFRGPGAPDRPIADAVARATAHRVTPGAQADPPPTDAPFRVLNVGSGGCPVRPDVVDAAVAEAAGREVVIDYNDHPDGAAALQAEHPALRTDLWVLDDAATLASVPDATYDLVYASHVAEHIPIAQVVAAVRNWVRVCKPGGRLFIAVPDVQSIGQYVCDGKLDVVLYRAAGLDITPRLILNGGQRYPGDTHCNSFDAATLRDVCYQAGVSERELLIHKTDAYEVVAAIGKGIDLVGEVVRTRIASTQLVPDTQITAPPAPAPSPNASAEADDPIAVRRNGTPKELTP